VNLPTLRRRSKVEERDSFPAVGVNDWLSMFQWNGVSYLPGMTPSLAGPSEQIGENFQGYVNQAYKSNGVVFACMLVRMLLFSEARFQFRQLRNGRPGALFGTPELGLLETPWPNGTTGDLLTRMIQDVDLAGNFFGLRQGKRLRRLRPDWVDIVLGTPTSSGEFESTPEGIVLEGDLDVDIIGYAYWPGGRKKGVKPVPLQTDQVAHFAPTPDPIASFRGVSWLTPIVQEIIADKGMTRHKQKFLDNGATPSMVIKLDITSPDDFARWVDKFRERQEGVENAYKTMFLAAGADPVVAGSNFQEFDFKVVQGAGETRIAAAAGVPPVIVGLSEGLAAATYSNYGLAMRRLTDLTMRPLWRNAAGSLATVVNVPSNAMLWYDDRDVPALSEDSDKQASIDNVKATTIHTLIAAGYEPDSVVATIAPDWQQLDHTGLYSVQLQPAGAVTEGKGAVVSGVPGPAAGAKQLPPPPGSKQLPAGKQPPAALEGKSGANGAAMSRREAEKLLAQFTAKGEQ
jgi:hypothetical protein